VDRFDAEAIYDAGREVVVEVLVRMDEKIRRTEARVAREDQHIPAGVGSRRSCKRNYPQLANIRRAPDRGLR
jgi:hypothetical protein